MAASKITGRQLEEDIGLPGLGAVGIPASTTANRPAVPVVGMSRVNTELGGLEVFVNGAWQFINPGETLAALQLRRTTTYVMTTTAVAVTFNVVDISTKPAVIYQGAITSRIYVTQAGAYQVSYNAETIETTNTATNTTYLRVNGTTTVPGSTTVTSSRSTRMLMSRTPIMVLAAGDYIELMALRSGGAGTLQIGADIEVVKLEGTKGDAGPSAGIQMLQFSASALDTPNNAGWNVVTAAPLNADPAYTSLTVRSFDDTAEEGTGFQFYVPPTATNLQISLRVRAVTAPAGNRVAVLNLYRKQIPMGAAPSAWATATSLSVTVSNAFYMDYTQTISLATLGLVAGQLYQFELTRVGSNASDTLVGDLALLSTTFSFS
jgi:hypothetical protein